MGKDSIALISVIIPVYNERRYLNACIESVINQSFHSFELILVDDGSNNGASEDCDTLAQKDTRIRVIHKKNEGLSAARITGLNDSLGEWIMFMDHDDIISPFALETYASKISADVDIIAGGRIDSSCPELIKWCRGDTEYITNTGKNICEKIPIWGQEIIITPMWGKIYRSTFLKSLDVEKYRKICPTLFFEDILMTPIIYSQARKIGVIKEKLYVHREIKTSISRSGKLSAFYFEQIDSGDILIRYAKNSDLPNIYSYTLGCYFRCLIRIYCLMDEYLDEKRQNSYKKKIESKLYEYKEEYFCKGKTELRYRLCCILFFMSPTLTKKLYRIFLLKS